MISRIEVDLRNGRHRTRLTSGLLRAQQVHGPLDRCRIGLLATTALLLGGDEVELEVEVGAGCTVELFDVAATVAYDGRGAGSAWNTRLRLHEGARLRWSGEPLVVSDGASVLRTLQVDLAPGSAALLRDTVALGRSGETGGRLRCRTSIRRAGTEVLIEDQQLDAATHRTMPGMLGRHRILDTITALGVAGPDAVGRASRFALPEQGSTLTRYLGTELSESPLQHAWRELRLDGAAVKPGATPSSHQPSPDRAA